MPVRTEGPCFCYILECADGSFYTGWTTDPERRLKTHNAGRGSRYTRARRPVQFVLIEPQEDRLSAMRRERAIKHMTRQGKITLIHGKRPRAAAKATAHTGKQRRRQASQ